MSEPRDANVRTLAPNDQEAIRMISGDYLDTLAQMVLEGRRRNDPTLAVALSIEVLGLLVDEVRAARSNNEGSRDG